MLVNMIRIGVCVFLPWPWDDIPFLHFPYSPLCGRGSVELQVLVGLLETGSGLLGAQGK